VRRKREAPVRAVIYCIVPDDLAGELHEPLRRHFVDSPVEVVVEQRWRDRRTGRDRRDASSPIVGAEDRRRIRAGSGRRVADRRATAIQLETPSDLPRKAAEHRERLVFIERLEPSAEQVEDRDTARVVARFQAGDRAAFEALYLRYFDRVYGYLRVMLHDPHEAEDLTQQVFAQVFEALPRYERRSQPFRAWLFRIVRNTGVSRMRQLRRAEPMDVAELSEAREVSSAEEPAPAALRWITDRELLMFVERLPLAQRQVVLLRFGLGMNSVEIGQVLEMSSDQVRAAQRRALLYLKERLDALGRGVEPGEGVRMRRWRRQAPVLRARRFALLP
jgi:RNA polymerase sigma-70 factor (ECF subfamily)